MKTLHDGTEVSDETPTKNVSGDRYLLTPEETAARQAEEAEARKPTAAHLSALRDAHLYGGIIFNSDISIGTDDLTQSRIMAARILAKEDPSYTVRWKLPAGFVTLDAPTIIAIADAIRTHVQACFEAEATVLIDIADYTTTAELEAAFHAALSS
jgi:hypothetical protein